MLAVLGGLAEFERDLIRTRTSEGRARAVARGVKLGPKPKLTPHQQQEAIKRRDRGDDRNSRLLFTAMTRATVRLELLVRRDHFPVALQRCRISRRSRQASQNGRFQLSTSGVGRVASLMRPSAE
jgi:DNA invertase Pin-like site-specific DNA recombinase